MPKILPMPKIGVNMVEGIITKWLVAVGDTITAGQMVIEAETDKAVQEIPAAVGGVVAKIIAAEGDKVECNEPIAVLVEPGEVYKEEAAVAAVIASVVAAPTVAAPTVTAAPVVAAPVAAVAIPNARVRISPLAKATAEKLGIDWRLVTPEKPGERIVQADVLKYSPQTAVIPAPVTAVLPHTMTRIPHSAIRRTIARRMSESWTTKPPVALTLHIEAAGLIAWRKALNANGTVKVGYNELIAKACAFALCEFPHINAVWENDAVVCLPNIGIGIAVQGPQGLTVPVLREPHLKGARVLAGEFADMVNRVQTGRATADDYSGGSFTISNLGGYGVEHFTPIINPPETCILGIGKIEDQVLPGANGIEVRPRMALTLVFDHRIVDGAPAAQFFARLKQLLEQPMEMLS